jgi:hypothetical protein
MGNKFICEQCGKEVDCGMKDPSSWKSKLCFDCRQAQSGGAKPSYTPKYGTTSKAPSVAKYQPTKSFNLETYINDMLDTYEAITYACEGRGLKVPQENLCAWVTSIMIQKEKSNG